MKKKSVAKKKRGRGASAANEIRNLVGKVIDAHLERASDRVWDSLDVFFFGDTVEVEGRVGGETKEIKFAAFDHLKRCWRDWPGGMEELDAAISELQRCVDWLSEEKRLAALKGEHRLKLLEELVECQPPDGLCDEDVTLIREHIKAARGEG